MNAPWVCYDARGKYEEIENALNFYALNVMCGKIVVMQVKIGNLKILLTIKLEISLMIFILKIIYFGCIEISANFLRALNFGRVCNYTVYTSIVQYNTYILYYLRI